MKKRFSDTNLFALVSSYGRRFARQGLRGFSLRGAAVRVIMQRLSLGLSRAVLKAGLLVLDHDRRSG